MHHKSGCESIEDRRFPCTCGRRTYTTAEAQETADYYADRGANAVFQQKWAARARSAKRIGEQSNAEQVTA